MLNKPLLYILLILIPIFIWQACDSSDPSINASRLRLKLTDATSLTLRELHVDIREIEAFLADTVSGEGEWITLEFSGRAYDILKLMNGKTVQLVDQYVPGGKELQRIKLVLGNDNRLVTNTDKSYPLHIPDDLREGIVIDAVKMELPLNTISSMIIDLNAAHSIRELDGTYFLHPVARAFPESYGGKLRGAVAPLQASPLVVIVQERDTLFTYPEIEKSGDEMAMFQFIGLKEGDWEVFLVPSPGSGYRDTVFISRVEADKTTEITPKPIRLKPL